MLSCLAAQEHRHQTSRRDRRGLFGVYQDRTLPNLTCKRIHFMYYTFARIHQTLRITPAMAAGVTSKLWDVADIVALLDQETSN
jgi:hypothetical protein